MDVLSRSFSILSHPMLPKNVANKSNDNESKASFPIATPDSVARNHTRLFSGKLPGRFSASAKVRR